jgi:hypothetical protein
MKEHFKPTVGSRITKADALKWIDRFDKERRKDTKSVFYGKETLLKILKDDSISGISFFFCRKSDKHGKDYDDLVLVPTRSDGTLVWGKDSSPEKQTTAFSIASAESELEDDGEGPYEDSTQCPPYCTR